MIPLFQNDKILDIDIIALQEPLRSTRDQTKYHPRKDSFHLLYSENDKTRVCIFINKKIDQSTWTYTTDGPDTISLHLNLPDECIHINNVYNPVNAEEICTNISILKHRLAAHPNEEQIALGDFNLHHEEWERMGASTALIEKSEELLMVTQRWKMEQMVPVGTTTYKESTGESIIDLIFTTPLLPESLISCGIEDKFDHDSDHQPILSQWMLQTVDSPLSSRLLLSKMYVPKLKKTLLEELVNDPPCHFQTANELDAQMYSLIGKIETAIALAIPKARLLPKSVPGFDEECKETQMKARRLKKMWKKEGTVESWEKFWPARAEKRRVIAKAKRRVYRKSKEEACASPDSMWKAVRQTKNRAFNQPCLPNIQKSYGYLAIEP